MSHDIEKLTPASAPDRRTVLAGAAWTVPVIAAATMAPFAAASNAAVLTFSQPQFSGTACGTITGVYVTVTVDGVATAGKNVTTTLSGGYTFADGSTSNTQTSDANGRVYLPAISIPAIAGSGAVTALNGQSRAVATATAPAVTGVGLNYNNSYFPALPAGVTATSVGWGSNTQAYFLGSDGFLYKSSNAASWVKVSPAGVQDFAIDTLGGAAIYTTGSSIGLDYANTYFPAVPAGVAATSVGFGSGGGTRQGTFLGSDGYLYRSVNAGAWAKSSPVGVKSFSIDTTGNAAIYTTGAKVGLDYNNSYFPALPAGVTATAVGFCGSFGTRGYFLGSDSYLYQSLNAGAWTRVSPSGVTHFTIDTTGYSAIYTTGTKIGLEYDSSHFPALPAGVTATSVGGSGNLGRDWNAYFLGSDKYLYTSVNGGNWSKTSPIGVKSFTVDSTGNSAMYALSSARC